MLQAEEAPSKQLEFIEAWGKATESNDAECWQKILNTAATFLSASQSKARQLAPTAKLNLLRHKTDSVLGKVATGAAACARRCCKWCSASASCHPG